MSYSMMSHTCSFSLLHHSIFLSSSYIFVVTFNIIFSILFQFVVTLPFCLYLSSFIALLSQPPLSSLPYYYYFQEQAFLAPHIQVSTPLLCTYIKFSSWLPTPSPIGACKKDLFSPPSSYHHVQVITIINVKYVMAKFKRVGGELNTWKLFANCLKNE